MSAKRDEVTGQFVRGAMLKLAPGQLEAAIALYQTGVPLRACVERLGLPIRWQSLRRHMVRRGIARRPAARPGGTGKYVTPNGYAVTCANGKKITRHRLVKATEMGRPLRSDEVVHHIDGNKLNNDPANLEILTLVEHSRRHTRELWANPEWRAKTLAAQVRARNRRLSEAASTTTNVHPAPARTDSR